MRPTIAIIAPVLFFASAKWSEGQTLEWGSAVFSDLVDSHGDALDNSFVFELGAFGSGFAPTEMNRDDWFANWRVFDTASYNVGNGYFTSTASVQDVGNYDSLFEGLDAYIWVRNDTTAGPTTEWFLGRKETGLGEWVFPALDPGCCPNGEVVQWSITGLGGDVPVWGNQGGIPGGGDFPDNGTFDLQTHVVPEPGSVLLVLLGGGLVFFHRRRTASANG